jgi:hypothetical protein
VAPSQACADFLGVTRVFAFESSNPSNGSRGPRAPGWRRFEKVAWTIETHADGILAYVATGLSNGRAEGLSSVM